MTNTALLRKIIIDSGLKYRFIAKKMDLSPYGLQRKIDNLTEFKASEIMMLCEILNIKDEEKSDIFFVSNSDLKPTSNMQFITNYAEQRQHHTT